MHDLPLPDKNKPSNIISLNFLQVHHLFPEIAIDVHPCLVAIIAAHEITRLPAWAYAICIFRISEIENPAKCRSEINLIDSLSI